MAGFWFCMCNVLGIHYDGWSLQNLWAGFLCDELDCREFVVE